MGYTVKMESVLIAIITVLCATLVLNLIYKLRLALPWRVNCWFCNQNFWMKFIVRNSWICPSCEQYNGFTKDGDYNKPVTGVLNDSAIKSPKVFQRSPPKNGLCKMCNVNQQLKVAQLANFVPMHESNFDNEIENYKMQLEKAYKLCSPCRKVLQKKLHKEKEVLLGSKVKETRSLDKKKQKNEQKSSLLKNFINRTSILIAVVLVVLVSIESYNNTNELPSTLMNLKNILTGLLDRLMTIFKMKLFLTFPTLENYSFDFTNTEIHKMLKLKLNVINIGSLDHFNEMTQKALGGLVCLVQILGHVCNANKLKDTVLIDILWSVFVVMSVADKYVTMEPIYNSLVKLTSLFAVLLVYKNMDKPTPTQKPVKIHTSPRIKNLRNGTHTSFLDEDNDIMLETDDDVSLSKFGLHNFTDSSTETISPLSSSMLNGRCFTPKKNDSIWSKSRLNSTFCVNSVMSKSPSSVSDTLFTKPSFHNFQNMKDDSDSDLDESISSLCISSPKKSTQKSNSIFALRKFTATPSFLAPAPLNRSRPLISPSKLGHSTSWVAGGYWGSEGERPIFSVNGSRSSSQSSGFESQASSANQRITSQPPSREESICGDPAASLLERFQNCNTGGYSNYQSPASFTRVSSPVFPQMQYNGHVHIPQARFAPQPAPSSVFSQASQASPQYPHDLLKPGGSGLINLAQLSSLSTR